MRENKIFCDRCKKDITTQYSRISVNLGENIRHNEFDYCDRFCLIKDFEDGSNKFEEPRR